MNIIVIKKTAPNSYYNVSYNQIPILINIIKMQKKYIPLIFFSFLFILAIPFESGFTIQSLSGWNNVIPSTSYLEIVILIYISILIFLYWKILKRQTEINIKLFILHFILTIPIVLWARFNFPIRQIVRRNANDMMELIDLINQTLYTVLILFFIGQLFFVALLLKTRQGIADNN